MVVIGGGINGVAIAADAAGRGLSVLLCEQADLACATSSASSKLIHGGLRYLEQYDFSLVRESLKEREILLRLAPHLVHPIRFIVPYDQQRRPFWFIRLGLYCYDLLSGHLQRSQTITFKNDALNPLKPTLKRGFSYSDCTVDDARLVVITALRAANNGAQIRTRTQCIAAKRGEEYWQVTLQNTVTQQPEVIHAKALINATGPWVEHVIQNVLHANSRYTIRLVKGSHIVVPQLYPGKHAYLLQHADGRVIFVIPYLQQFTMIGTTDVNYQGDPFAAKIDPTEITYLCQLVSDYFKKPLQPSDVIYAWSGVRPLVDDQAKNASAINRGYKIQLITEQRLPLMNIFGGKLTTHRILAEKAVNALIPFFPHGGKAWSARGFLPGGDKQNILEDFPWLPKALAERYAHSYGSLTYMLLENCTQLSDLGTHFGQGLYEKEITYLIKHEWAQTAEDILWRRTKMGLFLSPSEIQHFSLKYTG